MKKQAANYDVTDSRLLKTNIINDLKRDNWLNDESILKNKEYIDCVYDILINPKFKEMNQYIQHGETTTLDHCLSVSFITYKICRSYRLDYRSAARGALLHDFFLYDWHTHKDETGNNLHGFTHPRTALINAMKYFQLNKKEQDIILKHMWPLTVVPPKSMEGYVVVYVDKYCGFLESVKIVKKAKDTMVQFMFAR